MSLRGYQPKTKKALWTQTPEVQAERERRTAEAVLAKVERRRLAVARRIERARELAIFPRGKKAFIKCVVDFTRSKITEAQRRRVSPVSKRRQAQSSGYVAAARAFVAAEIEAGKTCPVFPGEPLAENHHRFGKRGRLLMWKPGWLAVSSKGHYWITNNTTSARVNGFVGPVGTWNDYERAVEHQRSKA